MIDHDDENPNWDTLVVINRVTIDHVERPGLISGFPLNLATTSKRGRTSNRMKTTGKESTRQGTCNSTSCNRTS